MKRLLLVLFVFTLAGNMAWGQTLPDNWTGDSDIDTYQSSDAHSGNYSCKVVVKSGTQANCDFNNTTSISVIAGKSFTVRFWYKTSAHVKGRLHLFWTGASAAYATYTDAGASSWKEFIYSGTVPSGATALSIGIRFYDQTGFSAPETQYIDDLTFESPTGTAKTVTNGDMESWSASSGNDQTSVVEAPASQIAAGSISSLKTTQADAVDVFIMKIVDKGSGDGLPTHVTNIRVIPGTNNTADWSNTIQGVTLNDGSAVTIGSPTITDNSIDIPITSGNLDIPDGGSKEVTLAVYLNTSNIEDGSILAFKVDASSPGFTADASGSGFASSFSADVVSNDFTLAVVGTQLAFSNVPSSVIINTDFSTTVSAIDANGNVDKDDVTSVTLSKNTGTGTLSSATGLTQSLSSGTYTWNDLQYNTTGTFKIAANGGSYSEIVTSDITASSPPKLIISEVSDPNDHTEGRFVEIYNMGSTNIDFSSQTWYLSRQANGSGWADVALTGTLNAGETYVIGYNSANFKGQYSFDADLYAGAISGSGNDGYFLYYGGDHSSGTLVDAYGVIDEDGTGKPWEYTDKHAVRLPDVTGPNATWTSSEWAITGANVADMTPSVYKVAFTWAGGTSADWGNKANWTIAGNAAPSIPDVSCPVTIPSGTANSCSVTGTPDYESDACSVTIASGASLTIPAGKALSTGDITNNGTLTIESTSSGNGSLIVHGTVTGSATVQRYLTNYTSKSNGWHFLSSPVADFTISGSDFAPTSGDDDLYEFDETASSDNWLNYIGGTFSDTKFEVGKGYLISYKTAGTKNFTGVINTGNVSKSLSYTSTSPYKGWNLLGNPYTAAIDWDNINKSSSVDGAVYVIQASDGSYVTWNGSAGDLSDGIIPAMNGFFVHATATGQTVTMKLADEVHSSTANYKQGTASAPATLKITVSGDNGSSNEYIQFRSDATTAFDQAIDAYKLFGFSNAAQIYTTDGTTKYSINCLPENITNYDLPLSIKHSDGGVYTLSFSGVEKVKDYNIKLEDLRTHEITPITAGETYSFSLTKEESPDCFVLHINGVTAVPGVNAADGLHIFSYGKTIYLNGQKALNGKVSVYNLMGQKVYESPLNGANKQQFRINQKNGIYFIRVERNNQVVTRKVFIQ